MAARIVLGRTCSRHPQAYPQVDEKAVELWSKEKVANSDRILSDLLASAESTP
jgi:hypothetical protein